MWRPSESVSYTHLNAHLQAFQGLFPRHGRLLAEVVGAVHDFSFDQPRQIAEVEMCIRDSF